MGMSMHSRKEGSKRIVQRDLFFSSLQLPHNQLQRTDLSYENCRELGGDTLLVCDFFGFLACGEAIYLATNREYRCAFLLPAGLPNAVSRQVSA